eukprot:TRINITY_DN9214_c0_g1_i1.p1 TRINITY_DN9214_c0_g1~~TRINITY_DN9214_c0_g1_i1.p1  ORF type:complete len:506 (+),score=55.98 TRINITY_DN9214_c0_g1_i1:70-1518(+)
MKQFSVTARRLITASLVNIAQVHSEMNFTIYSNPVELRYGQVYNTAQTSFEDFNARYFPLDVIARYANGEKDMAITGFSLDIVRIDAEGHETQVLLSDHYLHHYILAFGQGKAMARLADTIKAKPHLFSGCHAMQGHGIEMFQTQLEAEGHPNPWNIIGFGGAAGAEYRHNPQVFLQPYRLVLKKPEVWFPTIHLINTKDDPHEVSPLLECPCTPQRKIDPANGTIDGKRPHPPFDCSAQFAATGNPSCDISTYVGGWRCCEHGVFLIDTDKMCETPNCTEKPVDQVVLKFNFRYEDATPATRNIEAAACCDTTSTHQGFGNREHDVPQCPDGTPPTECLFVTESVQPLGHFHDESNPQNHVSPSKQAGDLIDLVFAAPHLHFAGVKMELIDHETNQTVCEKERGDIAKGVIYGNGTEPGNEKGYLVGLMPCVWNGSVSRRYRRDHLFRSRSTYDATSSHTGVMSLWLMSVSAVPKEALLFV